VQADIETCVDEVFAALETGFLTMPKGPGFIEYRHSSTATRSDPYHLQPNAEPFARHQSPT
jgi:hypothetical protein